ncbi:hypothetical protein M3180_17870 [Paenibacillus camelliae]|nr:hypothetical protein [Paenibacillus camelliae]
MKRISLFILTLLLLLTSIPTGYAIQKGDDVGQVLNLPPFVDFEVKEKRKVDVIIDVGNTSKTLDEVNSFINLQLRPKLQADGLDYKIHVEKSNEGKTRQYFAATPFIDNSDLGHMSFDYWGPLYYYDTLTNEVVKVSDTAIDSATGAINIAYMLEDEKTIFYYGPGVRLTQFGDPTNDGLVRSGQPMFYPYGPACIAEGVESDNVASPYDQFIGHVTLTQDGRIIGMTRGPANSGNWNNCRMPAYQVVYYDYEDAKRSVESLPWSSGISGFFGSPWGHSTTRLDALNHFMYMYQSTSSPWTDSDSIAKNTRFLVTSDGALYDTNHIGFKYYSSLDRYLASKGTIAPNYVSQGIYQNQSNYQTTADKGDYGTLKQPYKLDPATGDLIFSDPIFSEWEAGYGSTYYYTVSRFDRSENSVIKGKINEGSTEYYDNKFESHLHWWAITDDGRIVTIDRNIFKLIIMDDVDGEKHYIDMTGFDRTGLGYIQPSGLLGSDLFFTSTTKDGTTPLLYKLNLDTEEWSAVLDKTFIAEDWALGGRNKVDIRLIPYLEHVIGDKRYMIDVLNEVTYRSDAEKYYVRIDDSSLMQLNNSRNLADLAAEMTKQQVTYLALGTGKNEELHRKLLTTIDNRGRFITNTDMNVALQEVAGMITNRKEADLHVLIANETISLTTIKDGLKQLQTELQAENIISSIHYIQGTSTSKVFDLVSRINWRDDRNNYVIMFNRGSLSELSSTEYEVDLATELGGQYASYIAIGTAANKLRNESLIATNKSGGVFTSSTSMSAIKTVIAKHIKDTAVKNPKRVTDTLVLNYDQETGSYSSDLLLNTFYEDAENDPKFNERFKTTHDPTVYENHTGVMAGTGQYQPTPTTKFTKVGKYELVVQVQDNPSTNAAFANYREWSLDSLSRLVLFVHRAPVADFTATVNTSRKLTIVDLSYDLDRYSERNKGIVTAVWKWKKADDIDWTMGSPPTTLAANTDYLVSLKVKDRDGAWSNEVIKFVTTKDSNQPPVARFIVNPKSVSWSKNFTLTDQSYDPDGDPIITREWIVSKEGKQLLTKGSTPTGNEIKNAAINAGLNQLGTYQIRLRVQDSEGLWSSWYQDYADVVNHAPIAQFEPLTTTYRDTMNTVLNITENPDLDGDAVTYRWRLMKGDKTYSLGTTKDVSFRIRDRGLGKDAVGTWSLELRATDPLGAESYMTHSFQVLNQIPTAEIISYPVYGYVDEPYNFTANSDDPDSEDRSSLKYFWKLTTPSGKVISYYDKNLSNIKLDEKGTHTMEHWVQDQLGAESEVDKIKFSILNKRPVADFTRTPITAYRNVNIDFKSLGTDYDGWIEAYRYELLRDGLSPLTLSTDADFIRSFSSIGTFDIRHTVTDNDGASDSIVKKIYIVNRAPKAEVTQPSGTSTATATEFNTLNPTIRWTMTDADNDPQVQYQLQLKNQAGTVLRTTAATTTVNKYFTIPNGWLSEGPIYRVAVRVYDGYEWSDYSVDKYFYLQLNRPPTAGFTHSPVVIYEGDQLKIRHAVDDLDLDTLSIRYTVTAPDGQKSYYPNASSYYIVPCSKYNSDAFTLSQLLPGSYHIEQVVTDSKSEPVKLTRTIQVGQLSIVGQVAHTETWESHRNKYNESLPADSSKQWLPLQFYSGERFMLSADTTLADHAEAGSTTYAVNVSVLLQTTGTSVELSYEKDLRWTGSMWEEAFSNLARGKHTFTFNVHYSNGVIKQHDVDIEIIGKASELAGVHRWK